MPKRARDEGWVGKTVMLTPHAASGKRLLDTHEFDNDNGLS